ncbi:ribonuclease P protein component 1 [Halapricum salinum]|uniref:Ribonuclease P protein component 1 n=1 Tax=Halapricum salinum TaxID=1457250 RepID=A0A4D6H9J5_9EURY|nr:ribonuclease P protein component 1 [Halapricum salinum]QCC49722.1 ribonuclease P [Halapricum salinum]
MTRTPETLARHELIGLDVRVVAASNPDLLDVDGEVVMETTNTLHVERADRAWPARDDVPRDGRAGNARATQVPKAGTTFTFTLEDGQRVRIEGERLVARPARRTEHTGDSTWR